MTKRERVTGYTPEPGPTPEPPRRNSAILIEVTPELAAFVLENCESNIGFGLGALQQLTSRDLQQKLVAQLENFKALREATQAAIKDKA